MDPITIAMGLSQFAPQLIKWISGSDKAANVAQKAIDIAKAVTGQATGDAALTALQADPSLVLKYRQSVLDQEVEFEKIAVQNAADINVTMQAESKADHWPTYSWRPAIGFAFAFNLWAGAINITVAYAAVMFWGVKIDILSLLPQMLTAQAALNGTALPILGVASWFRGKMQADPNISSDNRG